LSPGRWTHLAAVYDGDRGSVAVFVNGIKVYSSNKVDTVDKISWDGKFLIGMYPVRGNLPSKLYLEGSMDEFGIYDESFDEEIVKHLMNNCDFNAGSMS